MKSDLTAGNEVQFAFGKGTNSYQCAQLGYHLDSTLANSYSYLTLSGMSGLKVYGDKIESVTPFYCPSIYINGSQLDFSHLAYTNVNNNFSTSQSITGNLTVSGTITSNGSSVITQANVWASGNNWDVIPYTNSTGYTKIGKYLDFYTTDTSTTNAGQIWNNGSKFTITKAMECSEWIKATNFGNFITPGTWDNTKTIAVNLGLTSAITNQSPLCLIGQNFPSNFWTSVVFGCGTARCFMLCVNKEYANDDIRIYFNNDGNGQGFQYTDTSHYSRLVTNRNLGTLYPNLAYKNIDNNFTTGQHITGTLNASSSVDSPWGYFTTKVTTPLIDYMTNLKFYDDTLMCIDFKKLTGQYNDLGRIIYEVSGTYNNTLCLDMNKSHSIMCRVYSDGEGTGNTDYFTTLKYAITLLNGNGVTTLRELNVLNPDADSDAHGYAYIRVGEDTTNNIQLRYQRNTHASNYSDACISVQGTDMIKMYPGYQVQIANCSYGLEVPNHLGVFGDIYCRGLNISYPGTMAEGDNFTLEFGSRTGTGDWAEFIYHYSTSDQYLALCVHNGYQLKIHSGTIDFNGHTLLDNSMLWTSGNNWGVIPFTDTSGYTKIGKYIDFFNDDTTTTLGARIHWNGTQIEFNKPIYMYETTSNTPINIKTNQTTNYIDIGYNANNRYARITVYGHSTLANRYLALGIQGYNALYLYYNKITMNYPTTISTNQLTSLKVNTSYTGQWIEPIWAMAANATSGQTVNFKFGKADSNRNSAYIGYCWNANSSDTNYLTLGIHSYDNLFNIYTNKAESKNKIIVQPTRITNKLGYTGTEYATIGYNSSLNSAYIGMNTLGWGENPVILMNEFDGTTIYGLTVGQLSNSPGYNQTPLTVDGKIENTQSEPSNAFGTNMMQAIFKLIYPIGSIYISMDKTGYYIANNNTEIRLDKYGCTFTLMPSGIFLKNNEWGIGDPWGTGTMSMIEPYTVGVTGGSSTHTITINEIPDHTHQVSHTNMNVRPLTGSTNWPCCLSQGIGDTTGYNNVSTGVNGHSSSQSAIPTEPPYQTVYLWKRII